MVEGNGRGRSDRRMRTRAVRTLDRSAAATHAAESPSGLDVSLRVPQTLGKPVHDRDVEPQDAKVTLPEGMTRTLPGLGAGFVHPAAVRSGNERSLPGEGCPPESKIGSIEIETPLLAEKIDGAVYIATPYDNPEFGDPEHLGGSLLALYIVAKDPARGILDQSRGQDRAEPRHGTARDDIR